MMTHIFPISTKLYELKPFFPPDIASSLFTFTRIMIGIVSAGIAIMTIPFIVYGVYLCVTKKPGEVAPSKNQYPLQPQGRHNQPANRADLGGVEFIGSKNQVSHYSILAEVST